MRLLEKGFTLIELMVIVAITIILVSIGLPGMQSLMEGTRVRTASNEILSNLLFARSHAVNSGIEVTICPLNSSNKCVDQWNLGMSIFIDANSNQIFDTGDTSIKVGTPITGTDTVKFNNGHWVNFKPDGITNRNGTFSYCTQTQDPVAVTLSSSGRARVNNSAASCS